MGRLASFFARLTGKAADPADLAELEEILIESDLGAAFAEEIVALTRRAKSDELVSEVTRHLKASLSSKERRLSLNSDGLTTFLVVGVNGTGKTTTVAKLADRFHRERKLVVLAAADTFRAAAVDQLQTWGERIGVSVVTGAANSDPAAVAFDAVARAIESKADILIIDTAGRLHTKGNLMAELTKVAKVVAKGTSIDETIFVLDGTTGQNGIAQAETFAEAVPITGIAVTKLDGSTKGGVALAVERALGIPVKLIGIGEGSQDLVDFDPERYIAELLTRP
jgi:fused signal recognition particle receptor